MVISSIIYSAPGLASAAYVAIVARWTMVINKFHKEVLADDASFEYKDHPVFKTILMGRALGLASIAPVMAFFKPSYLDQFLNGVKLPLAKRLMPPGNPSASV